MSISFNLESPLSALSLEALADRLGKEQAKAKIAAQKVKDTQAEILARYAREDAAKSATGNVYKYTIVDGGTRESFSAKIAKTFLTASQIQECTQTVDVAASVRIYGA
jgi:hypothetical protein